MLMRKNVNNDVSKDSPIVQGQVFRRLISANPGLNFNPNFFFFGSKAFSVIIFAILFRVSSHQIVDEKNENELVFVKLL